MGGRDELYLVRCSVVYTFLFKIKVVTMNNDDRYNFYIIKSKKSTLKINSVNIAVVYPPPIMYTQTKSTIRILCREYHYIVDIGAEWKELNLKETHWYDDEDSIQRQSGPATANNHRRSFTFQTSKPCKRNEFTWGGMALDRMVAQTCWNDSLYFDSTCHKNEHTLIAIDIGFVLKIICNNSIKIIKYYRQFGI